jgi:PAP2 superfamily.
VNHIKEIGVDMNFKYMNIAKGLIPILISMIILLSFISTHVLAQNRWLRMVDLSVQEWFSNQFGDPNRVFGHGFINNIMTFCATFGDVKIILIVATIIAVLLTFYKKVPQAIWLIITMTSGALINYLIKQTIERSRPENHLIVDTGWSFPSGHSNINTLFFLMIMIIIIPLIRQRAFKFIITILSIAFWISVLISRLYFHAHYFSDVVGGVSLAIIWVSLFILVSPLLKFGGEK